MIIVCPNCKAEFEVDPAIALAPIDFQCGECEFVWTAAVAQQPASAPSLSHHEDALRGKLLKGLGVSAERPLAAAKPFLRRNAFFALCGAAAAFILAIAIDSFQAPGKSGADDFASAESAENPSPASGLEIELVKPFESFKEGLNTYVMVSGSVANTSREALPVPRLAILLLNREKRIMQEQVREIDAKTLAPGESAYFKYRVLRFSDKVEKVRVVFADESKI
ncbi:MAG: zinc-ribbon domain-containing protein [Rickettsiales bacterium]|jgi:predicted Zn finger-like uncharacterized protein|nr:zinc-ribbon domain-containing protein [Rickettsiales bacterium]